MITLIADIDIPFTITGYSVGVVKLVIVFSKASPFGDIVTIRIEFYYVVTTFVTSIYISRIINGYEKILV